MNDKKNEMKACREAFAELAKAVNAKPRGVITHSEGLNLELWEIEAECDGFILGRQRPGMTLLY